MENNIHNIPEPSKVDTDIQKKSNKFLKEELTRLKHELNKNTLPDNDEQSTAIGHHEIDGTRNEASSDEVISLED